MGRGRTDARRFPPRSRVRTQRSPRFVPRISLSGSLADLFFGIASCHTPRKIRHVSRVASSHGRPFR